MYFKRQSDLLNISCMIYTQTQTYCYTIDHPLEPNNDQNICPYSLGFNERTW